MTHCYGILCRAIVICLSVSFARAQETETIDLLSGFDPEKSTVAGTWRNEEDGGISVAPGKVSRCALKGGISGKYELTVEFTRTAGNDSVALILPMGEKSPALELGSWQGEAHGLSRVYGLPSKHDKNPTSVKPGTLENDKRYQLTVSMDREGDIGIISAKLNGKTLFDFEGELSRIDANLAMNLPQANTIGLGAQNSAVTFHRVILRHRKSDEKPTPNPAPGNDSLLSKLEPFNGAAFSSNIKDDRETISAKPEVGANDRGAFLKGVEFSEGTIEVELKGAGQPGGSFVGVAFHGVDGKTYDSVYFRPFNFGHSDPVRRGHAVQYMSHPDFPWDELRKSRPEEFENPAKPEPQPDEWFQAKIEVKNGRVKAYVNGATEPCLDVEKLGEIKTGKVGLWFNGVASWRGLKIIPTNQ